MMRRIRSSNRRFTRAARADLPICPAAAGHAWRYPREHLEPHGRADGSRGVVSSGTRDPLRQAGLTSPSQPDKEQSGTSARRERPAVSGNRPSRRDIRLRTWPDQTADPADAVPLLLADIAEGTRRAPELDRAARLDRQRAGLPPGLMLSEPVLAAGVRRLR